MATAETENSSIIFVTKFDRIWSNEHLSLNYENECFNAKLTQQRWQDQGHVYRYYTGDMYDSRKPQPSFVDILCEQLGWQHCLSSFYCMPPGRILPEHRDTYKKYRELFNVDNPYSIWRTVVFLEDWQSGHYLEVADCPITGWQAGDAILWQYNTPHLAANLGRENRYTLQLTGIMNEDKFTQRMGPVEVNHSWNSGQFTLPKQ